MSELEQLKQRIDASGHIGVATAHIRDDYEPAGDMMIARLCADGSYVHRVVPVGIAYLTTWKIFKKEFDPY
jgi:hypothetical protein